MDEVRGNREQIATFNLQLHPANIFITSPPGKLSFGKISGMLLDLFNGFLPGAFAIKEIEKLLITYRVEGLKMLKRNETPGLFF